ncbi:MAG: glycosyltransferase [Nitrospinae bacterium]|nr:glycosyltransferase [Nitrospinota bacterium]
MKICVGIHVHTEPERLHATLTALRSNTGIPVDVILLPDGPDAIMQAALATLQDLPQLGSHEPLGPPACLNRLIAATDADILVLLEGGALVGPGWLDYLLAALATDERNGLAGPSTNRSWNEQGVFLQAGGSLAEVAHTAAEARRRFGTAVRTLEPLYSLADFCYVVRREVIAAIGAVDEGYGLGPCWEMDYNVRAARAGWRGVWACAAYVYRAPFTARRKRDEQQRFVASKHRYQDKFCALRQRGARPDYAPHCHGDACEHFALPSLIQIALPPPASDHRLLAADDRRQIMDQRQRSDPPLVSCIMPTRNRVEFVLQSIRFFQRQDYPCRELIIIDDGTESLSERLPADERIRYVHLPGHQSIGGKRNWACEHARGAIIAHWDDDDWYAPHRLSAQVAPLLAGEAEISALQAGIFFDLPHWAFWRCTPDLHRRLFTEDAHGGTLVYRRYVWEQHARYPEISLAEDALFLRQAVHRGMRLHKQPGEDLFIYLRHGDNSWAFACGQFLDPSGWQRVGEPVLPPDDRAFYAARSPAAASSVPTRTPPALSTLPMRSGVSPLVSCIMPTYNRRAFVPQAIAYFLRQDYEPKELIVVDDGADSVADLMPRDPRIHYLRQHSRATVGAKRNLACEQSRGEIIAHWDDDDWHAPHRLWYQVEALLRSGADLCGINTLLFYDLHTGRAWQYTWLPNQRLWLSGSTLCYTRAFWARHRFANLNVGEDARFVWSARSEQMVVLPDATFHVGLIHGHNVAPKRTEGPYWQPYALDKIRQLLGDDWYFYQPETAQTAGAGPESVPLASPERASL